MRTPLGAHPTYKRTSFGALREKLIHTPPSRSRGTLLWTMDYGGKGFTKVKESRNKSARKVGVAATGVAGLRLELFEDQQGLH
jgi:hypothetical protein